MSIIEYDKNGNAYEVEQIEQRYKICPLTGKVAEDFFCDRYDCSRVKPDEYDILYGKEYHCEIEYKKIKDEFDGRMKRYTEKLKAAERRSTSLETARTIELDCFFDFCKDLKEYLFSNRQSYDSTFTIKPYHEPDDSFIVFWFDKDKVVDFSVTENLVANINNHFVNFRDNSDYKVSYRLVPGYLAEAVRIYFCLQYGVETKNILRDDNPVYIKARNLKRYLESAYGMSLQDFKEIRKLNPWLTEISDFDSVLMLKQEIDEVIRRNTMLQ